MKRALFVAAALGLVVGLAGCDQLEQNPALKALLVSKGLPDAQQLMEQDRVRTQDRLQDGSCGGDGDPFRLQYRQAGYGGGPGGNGGGPGQGGGNPGGGGQGDGDRLRLRDGSCSDGL